MNQDEFPMLPPQAQIFYNLGQDGKTPEPCGIDEWDFSEKRIVAQEYVADAFVSTVFLGVDHRWNPNGFGLPILFETMVFDGAKHGTCRRYATWAEAEAGHKEIVAELARPIS